MNHYELIAQCSEHLPKDLLSALVKALSKKSKQPTVATKEEEARFEELWSLRKQFPSRNGGDPKKTALEKFCVRIREKDAPQEHILFGIRCEFSKPIKDASCICQMETFMSQRRWETYTYVQPQSTVVPIRTARPRWLEEYEQKRGQA
jgi:hypothetical protein